MLIADVDPQFALILGAIVGPIGAYLAAARRFSGKVDTTEATDLWKEAASIRKWSTDRIESLEKRVGDLEQGNSELVRENVRLTKQVRELNDTISGLRTEIVSLTVELEKERRRVHELEGGGK